MKKIEAMMSRTADALAFYFHTITDSELLAPHAAGQFIADRSNAAYSVGLSFYTEKNYTRAYNWFNTAAKLGDKRAQYKIARMLFYGKGKIQINIIKAKFWYEKSADQLFPSAIDKIKRLYQDNNAYLLARHFYEGWNGHIQSDVLAKIFYIKSIKNDENVDAYYWLSTIYENGGRNLNINYQKAYEYYVKTIEETTNTEYKFYSIESIINLYADGIFSRVKPKTGSDWARIGHFHYNKEQYQTSFSMYTYSLSFGYLYSKFFIASQGFHKQGFHQTDYECLKTIKSAIEKGWYPNNTDFRDILDILYKIKSRSKYIMSKYLIGLMYAYGPKEFSNFKKAENYLFAVADLNINTATNQEVRSLIVETQYQLGLLIKNTQVHDLTRQFLIKAANAGHYDACYELSLLFVKDYWATHDGDEKQFLFNRIEYYLEIAAQKYETDAYYQLGLFYWNVSKNEKRRDSQSLCEKAIGYLGHAAYQGDEEAQYQLALVYANKDNLDDDAAIKITKLFLTATAEKDQDVSLKESELRPGDILLKYNDGSLINNFISQVGNIIKQPGSNPIITHAAIYLGEINGVKCIIEANRVLQIRPKHKDTDKTEVDDWHNFNWEIFRYNNNRITELASQTALDYYLKSQVQRISPNGKIKSNAPANFLGIGGRKWEYSIKSACQSLINKPKPADIEVIEKKMSDLLDGKKMNKEFFCSHFVIMVYAIASALAHNSESDKIHFSINLDGVTSPQNLHFALLKDLDWKLLGFFAKCKKTSVKVIDPESFLENWNFVGSPRQKNKLFQSCSTTLNKDIIINGVQYYIDDEVIVLNDNPGRSYALCSIDNTEIEILKTKLNYFNFPAQFKKSVSVNSATISSNLSGTSIHAQIMQFLKEAPDNYSNYMRHPDSWGGQWELGIIAKYFEKRIRVCRNRQVCQNSRKYHIVAGNNYSKTIYLLLTGEDHGNGHYTVMHRANLKSNQFVEYKISGDGSCLFKACLIANDLLEKKTERQSNQYYKIDPRRVQKLRDYVCRELLNHYHSQIIQACWTIIRSSKSSSRSDIEKAIGCSKLIHDAAILRTQLLSLVPSDQSNIRNYINDFVDSLDRSADARFVANAQLQPLDTTLRQTTTSNITPMLANMSIFQQPLIPTNLKHKEKEEEEPKETNTST